MGCREAVVSILLGVDTGGTYTDAVLMRGEAAVIARAKARSEERRGG